MRYPLGSTVALAGPAGAMGTQYTYEPFGNTTVSGPASANPTQFSGRENDAIGLYFLRARYYSPTFQRFISEDPLGVAGGANLYAYAGNNPISLRDLLGLHPKQAFQVSGCLLTPMGSLDCPAQNPRAASDLGTAAAVVIGGIFGVAARLAAAEDVAGEVAAEEAAGEGTTEGLSSSYVPKINPGAGVPNIATDATADEAAATLEENGFTATTSSDGQATIYTDASGNEYVIRPSNSSPSGKAMDFTPAGSSTSTLKIILGSPK